MRILIVNAYHPTEQGLKSFQFFQQAIQKAFYSQKLFNKEEIKITSVDLSSIDDYLYEQSTIYMKSEAEKKFDYLDFVFIDGEPNMLPWYPRSEKLLILMRMCKRTKKVLFAAGCGMIFQVYLSSNKYHIRRVINGKGKGTCLSKIFALKAEELGNIQAGEVFLDSGTGDIYCYDNTVSEFVPVANIGLHHHKTAEDMENKQVILKSFKYQPRNFDFVQPINAGKRSEAVCRVIKRFVQHWLVKEVGLGEFLISQKNSWDVHAVNLSDFDSHFTILAESDRSPQVISLQNTAAVLFNIDVAYPVSLKILNNFIEHMLNRYQEETKIDVALNTVPYSVMPCKPTVINPSRPLTASSAKLQTSVFPLKTHKTLRPASSHSGFAISKRNYQPVIIQNNATRQDTIQVNPPRAKELSDTLSLPESKFENVKIKGNFDKSSSVFNLRQQLGCANTSVADLPPKIQQFNTETSRINSAKTNHHQTELFKIFNSQEPIEENYKTSPWTKTDIREMLHGKTNFNSEASLKKPKIKIVSRPSKKKKESKLASTLNYKSKSLRYPFLGSVTSTEPYVEPFKAKIREEARPNEWISQEGFNVTNSKKLEKSPVLKISETYFPVSSHKFREENKSKWIEGSFKLA